MTNTTEKTITIQTLEDLCDVTLDLCTRHRETISGLAVLAMSSHLYLKITVEDNTIYSITHRDYTTMIGFLDDMTSMGLFIRSKFYYTLLPERVISYFANKDMEERRNTAAAQSAIAADKRMWLWRIGTLGISALALIVSFLNYHRPASVSGDISSFKARIEKLEQASNTPILPPITQPTTAPATKPTK